MICFFDVDGVFTDGGFYQSIDGKQLKKFGADDWDALDVLMKYHEVRFITADKKGFPIVKSRFVEKGGKDWEWNLHLVSNKPDLRWTWILSFAVGKLYNPDDIVYVGDGIFDYFSLKNAALGITTCDALDHVIDAADVVINRKGGSRFVAECCLEILRRTVTGFKIEEIGQ